MLPAESEQISGISLPMGGALTPQAHQGTISVAFAIGVYGPPCRRQSRAITYRPVGGPAELFEMAGLMSMPWL